MSSSPESRAKNYTLLVKLPNEPRFHTIIRASRREEAYAKCKQQYPKANIIITESCPVSTSQILGTKETIARWRRDNRIY